MTARKSTRGSLEGLMDLPFVGDEVQPPGDAAEAAAGVPPSSLLSLCRMVEANGGSSLEDVSGFDALRARNRGLFPLAGLPPTAAGQDGFNLENVIGADNLLAVPDTTALPWRSIAHLSITYESGNRATGTAWFYGARVLGTAAHNIIHPEAGRATEILVSPAFDGRIAPFGSFRATRTWCDPRRVPGNWDDKLDFGALMIDDASVGQRLGWFGFAMYGDRDLNKLLVNVCGYPTDRLPKTQYYNGGRLDGLDADFLRYTFDTVGGMSGAPIFARFATQRIVIGVHTSGNDRANRAKRIDTATYNALAQFAQLAV